MSNASFSTFPSDSGARTYSWAPQVTASQLRKLLSETCASCNEVGSIYELLTVTASKTPRSACLGWREPVLPSEKPRPNPEYPPPFMWLSYGAVLRRATQLGVGLVRTFKLYAGDKVAIYADNCPWWTVVMLACMSQSLIFVPIYDTLDARFAEFVCNDAGVKVVVASPDHARALAPIVPRCATLHGLVVMDYGGSCLASVEADTAIPLSADLSTVLKTNMEMILAAATDADSISYARPGSWDMDCCVLYTSGAEGRPRGVILKVLRLRYCRPWNSQSSWS
jgi:long-subunit acyl-CoA synthetase (AMP-forming)